MGELGLPGQQLSHLSLKAEHLTPDLTGTLGVPRPLRGPVSPGQWTLSSLSPTSPVGLWKTREHSWTLGLARPLLGHSGPAWETQIWETPNLMLPTISILTPPRMLGLEPRARFRTWF